MTQTTKDLFKGISQIDICLSVFIFQNKNSCIRSIINESPTTFRFMQIFEMNVIKNTCFVQKLYSSDLTLYVHMNTPSLTILRIQATPQGSLSISNTGATLITFLTHQVFSISNILVSFTLLGGNCL